METIVTTLDHKPFGQYSIKKSFQNYERLRHRLRFFEPAKFAYTPCIKDARVKGNNLLYEKRTIREAPPPSSDWFLVK